jgi:hypothetical protein
LVRLHTSANKQDYVVSNGRINICRYALIVLVAIDKWYTDVWNGL